MQRTSMSFKSWLGQWRMQKVLEWWFKYWFWLWYGHWSLIHTCSIFGLYPDFKGAEDICVLEIWGFGGCWRFLTGVWDLDLDMVTGLWYTHAQSFDYPDFKGAENISVLKIWGFGGCWRFLTGVWDLDLDLDMVIDFWYTHVWNIGSLSWFWKCKEHQCPLSAYIDIDMVTGILYIDLPSFGSLSWFWKCKEHQCPLRPHLGLCGMLEVPDCGFGSWSWFAYGHWSFVDPCS